jgi:hypothetical protein
VRFLSLSLRPSSSPLFNLLVYSTYSLIPSLALVIPPLRFASPYPASKLTFLSSQRRLSLTPPRRPRHHRRSPLLVLLPPLRRWKRRTLRQDASGGRRVGRGDLRQPQELCLLDGGVLGGAFCFHAPPMWLELLHFQHPRDLNCSSPSSQALRLHPSVPRVRLYLPSRCEVLLSSPVPLRTAGRPFNPTNSRTAPVSTPATCAFPFFMLISPPQY